MNRKLQPTISGSTKLLGLLGWPVAHSFSPRMHNAALAALGLDYVYLPLPVPPTQLATAVAALPALGFMGCNVTVPHKQTILPLLDQVSPAAQALGAVNTVCLQPTAEAHLLVGHNSDWGGFLADLARLGVAVDGRDCLLLGAGGSARAVAYGLAQSGGRVQLLARRLPQAEALVAGLRPFVGEGQVEARPWSDLAAVCGQVARPLIVNSTPVGMTPAVADSPWPRELPLPTGAFVYDLVYNPRETQLMKQAAAQGATAVNGLGMLLHQGAIAFELWTGYQPDLSLMQQAIA